ncbi:acyl-CoA thioesterase [Salinibacterium hongtaonis]|uniref:Acyl-CoA thioesterase n=1 Tax=Homoserinimonas hongtaonis TaxID=2079791 RepID=A0A2U1T314_9MICO|nr:thioesterase family protein [Salinibacterium hongtaonis]AWB88468.1 acyl-CoA thioesterase [Salinibacterium hongtaonis]PWB98248.1 acyl-CoA thioesterase [Salinibacterium hongtaonis]
MPGTYVVVVPLRWSDVDVNGHVNNARVATLLEEARVSWRSNAVIIDGIDSFGRSPFVASATTNYRRPVEYGSEFVVDVSIRAVGTSSYTMGFVARQSGQVVIDGSTVMVVVDDSGASRPLDQTERDYLERWAATGD